MLIEEWRFEVFERFLHDEALKKTASYTVDPRNKLLIRRKLQTRK